MPTVVALAMHSSISSSQSLGTIVSLLSSTTLAAVLARRPWFAAHV